MKKSVLLGVVFVALLFVTMNSSALDMGKVQNKIEKIYQNDNIVFVGDSIFDWYPTEKIFSDFPVVNTGAAGNLTTDVLNDIENRIYKYNPTKVFIQIGTNDLEQDDSDELNEQVFENIVKIAQGVKTHRKKCEIYIVSILPVNTNLLGNNNRNISEIKTVNDKLEKYCATTEGINYINAFSQLADGNEMFDSEYTNDGLHPNGLGYAKLTEILMKYIYQ